MYTEQQRFIFTSNLKQFHKFLLRDLNRGLDKFMEEVRSITGQFTMATSQSEVVHLWIPNASGRVNCRGKGLPWFGTRFSRWHLIRCCRKQSSGQTDFSVWSSRSYGCTHLGLEYIGSDIQALPLTVPWELQKTGRARDWYFSTVEHSLHYRMVMLKL